jgi:transcriptional regulator with XRE-family HTH domain
VVALADRGTNVATAAAEILAERKTHTPWTVRAIAADLGWATTTVQRYLTGKRLMPIDALYRLCALLGVDPVDVLLEAEQRLKRSAIAEAEERLPQVGAGG